MVTVLNLNDSREFTYSCSPAQAVRNAYAQHTLKDFNTWGYAKYDHLVKEGKFTYSCGDFTCLKAPKVANARP